MEKRITKYRAWDGKRMRSDILVGSDGQVFCDDVSDRNEQWNRKVDWKLLEFTGLRDKNKNDIYEGDIIKFLNKLMVIKFMNAQFVATDGNGIYTIWINDDGEINVVGNKFENPELLVNLEG